MHTVTLPVSRRHFLTLAGGFAGAQFCAAIQSEASELVPQPYFAGVTRILEALARLGAPLAAADAEHIAVLASLGDRAAVDEADSAEALHLVLLRLISRETDAPVRRP
jgi:hypothetical protein